MRICLALIVLAIVTVSALPAKEKEEEVELLSRLVNTLKAMAVGLSLNILYKWS